MDIQSPLGECISSASREVNSPERGRELLFPRPHCCGIVSTHTVRLGTGTRSILLMPPCNYIYI